MSYITKDVWALRIIDEPATSTSVVRATDCMGDPFLVFESEQDAINSAAYHLDAFDIACEPVRLVSHGDAP